MYCSGKFSSSWRAVKGVRQGAATSAYLFCVYLDDILENVDNQPMGAGQAYAEDVVVCCPTTSGLRRLLITLENKLNQNEFL